MAPAFRDILLHWQVYWNMVFIFVAFLALYGRGWWILRRRGFRQIATGWRLTAAVGGVFFLVVAMFSPVDYLVPLFFTAHMVQHVLITMWGPPLLLLADPYPFLLWGLPARLRRVIAPYLRLREPYVGVARRLFNPWLIWIAFVATSWIWYLPSLYDAALYNETLHELEHITLFVTALLFWWQITGSAPRLAGRRSYAFRMVYVLSAVIPNEVLGVLITLYGQPMYEYYASGVRAWGMSVMDDQMLAGAVMWENGTMYVAAAVALLGRLLGQQERKETTGVAPLAT